MPVPIHLRPYLVEWPLPDGADRKVYFETTHRILPPEETLQRIAPAVEKAGITRVSDITDLDSIGIPTYMAVRPGADLYDENITVYNGKGLTRPQAKASALMEALERDAGERHERPALLETFERMARYGTTVQPDRLILGENDVYDDQSLLEWIPGIDLFTGEPRFVPANAVFCPYRPKRDALFLPVLANSNGMASGNTIWEAISSGLAEVIERDAETLAVIGEKGAPIDLATIENPLIVELIEKFNTHGVNVHLKDITSDVGIPTFVASTDDPVTRNPMLLCRGIGTHVSAEIAVMRAISEAAQSRCAFISGAREDLVNERYKNDRDYQQLIQQMSYWYDLTSPKKDFRRIKRVINGTGIEDIRAMLKALQRCGLREAIAVNLTRDEVLIPAVHIIVPGLERSMESSSFGPRAKEMSKHAKGRFAS